jgi:hypothetical protein
MARSSDLPRVTYRAMKKNFVCYYHFVGWDCISFGGHICIGMPNIELHLPFGFIRIGWVRAFGSKARVCVRRIGNCASYGYVD